jgi:hypothetical protein
MVIRQWNIMSANVQITVSLVNKKLHPEHTGKIN